MSFYNVIERINIEHSSICNAACPQCTREFKPGDYSWFDQTWLPTEFYEDRIPQNVYDNLKVIYFSGMVGDSCTAPNFLEVCKVIRRKAPECFIHISTNGGMKTPKFWTELATILGEKGSVQFAIDGLEDTNHIYRVNVKWNKVVENVKAFRAANGKAEWQFIAFKHNEHQIPQVEELAREWGMEMVRIKRSNKFLVDDLFELTNQGGNGVKIEYPTQEEYVHPLIFQRDRVSRINEAMNITEDSSITCEAQENKAAYISASGNMFPCVFTATCVHLYKFKPLPDTFKDLWETCGQDHTNLKINDWDNIVTGEFFNKIQEGWLQNYKNGKLAACGLFCSNSSCRIMETCIETELPTKDLTS